MHTLKSTMPTKNIHLSVLEALSADISFHVFKKILAIHFFVVVVFCERPTQNYLFQHFTSEYLISTFFSFLEIKVYQKLF